MLISADRSSACRNSASLGVLLQNSGTFLVCDSYSSGLGECPWISQHVALEGGDAHASGALMSLIERCYVVLCGMRLLQACTCASVISQDMLDAENVATHMLSEAPWVCCHHCFIDHA